MFGNNSTKLHKHYQADNVMLIKFRVVSSIHLQNVMVRQLPKQKLLANSHCFCVLAVCNVFGCSRRFSQAFWPFGEPDVQYYAPAENIFTANFLYITYYVENDVILFCRVTHHTNYIMYLDVIQTEYRCCNIQLLAFSNYYFSKINILLFLTTW